MECSSTDGFHDLAIYVGIAYAAVGKVVEIRECSICGTRVRVLVEQN